jgi:hypothetical protein
MRAQRARVARSRRRRAEKGTFRRHERHANLIVFGSDSFSFVRSTGRYIRCDLHVNSCDLQAKRRSIDEKLLQTPVWILKVDIAF